MPVFPNNHAEFEAMVATYAHAAYQFGEGTWLDYNARNHNSQRYPSPSSSDFGAIDGAGNPWGLNYNPYNNNAAEQEHYLAIFTGKFHVATGGTYSIGLDGDDAVEVIIDGGTASEVIIGYYGAHGTSGDPAAHSATVTFASDSNHTIEYRMMEYGGGDQYYLYWNGPDSGSAWQIVPAKNFTDLKLSTYRLSTGSSLINNLEVRVKVCDPAIGLESNCKQYPDGNYKPIGLLQRHGESKRMYFGLMTGSYAKNTSGGVLRKRMGDISDEIETTTSGIFKTSVNGIIQTINKLRIYGFEYGSYTYNQNCGWMTNGPMTEGQCRDWGNPIGEMMYETMRYFAGKGSATPAYDYTGTTDDSNLGLPKEDTWKNPYDKANGGFDSCSKPFMLVLSDINPNFDSDKLPGVYQFETTAPTFTGDVTGRDIHTNTTTSPNVVTQAHTISTQEGVSGKKYIGQSQSTFDTVCSVKDVNSLENIRGLCPEEPTKQGSYYSAGCILLCPYHRPAAFCST